MTKIHLSMFENENDWHIDLISLPKKSFWKLTVPIAIYLIFNALYSIVDMIWVTNLGFDATFAVSTAAPIFALIVTFGDSIGQGTNSIMSRYIGSNDYESAYNSLIHGILTAVFVSILIIFSILFIDDILSIMLYDDSIGQIMEYLIPLFIFSCVFIISTVFCETFQVEGNSKTPVAIMVSANILNLVIDPILIYGLNMGVSGAAYASIVSQFFALLTFLYIYTHSKTKVPLRLGYFKFRPHILFEILKVALPNFLDDSMSCILAVFINWILILNIGEIGLVLYAVSIKIRTFLRAPIKGMGRGLMSVTGHLFGAKKINELNVMYIYVLKMALVASLAISLLFFFLRNQLYASFSIVGLETSIFYIALFGIVMIMVYPFSYISAKMLNGFGKSIYALIFNVLKIVLQIILINFLLDAFPEGVSVLVGLTLGEIIFSAVYFITLKLLLKRFDSHKDQLQVT